VVNRVCDLFTIRAHSPIPAFQFRIKAMFARSRAYCIAVLLVVFATVAAVTGAAMAEGGSIAVKVNMARILRINSPAATVIIGNPGIADVTIQDPTTLILTGKSYGRTNLIILDSVGNPIADTILEVVQDQAELMTVYQGTSRTTLACEPECQPVVMLGDDPSFTSNTITSSDLVESIAGQ
jgi:Flp pilus assembly secretin CpaC